VIALVIDEPYAPIHERILQRTHRQLGTVDVFFRQTTQGIEQIFGPDLFGLRQ
jgi:hypothetical protein